MCGVELSRVEERADKVVIVATGPSAQFCDLNLIPPDVFVIAVKDAILFAPRCNAWSTVDVNPRAIRRMKDRVPGVKYYAAVPENYGTKSALFAYHKEPVEGIHYLRRVSFGRNPQFWRLCEETDSLASGNSAFGALNIAYHMRAQRIVLVGVDASQRPYVVCSGRPTGMLTHLPLLFNKALPQLSDRGIQVINASVASRVSCFARVSWEQSLDWLLS